MWEEEDFLVEVPASVGLEPGDVLIPRMEISLGRGLCLGRGRVVSIDRDPSQELMPLFFVEGLRTGVRSVLGMDQLGKKTTLGSAVWSCCCRVLRRSS